MSLMHFRAACAATFAAVLVAAAPVSAQQGNRISITTGGTGGVYYPLGGGMANILSKYVPGMQATAEVTGGSVDNLKLIGAGKSEVGFSMVDAAWDAAQGQDKFKDNKVNARTLMVLYPNRMQIVTVDGTGITKLSDLKGKRVSTGSPGSGVEVMALRVLDAVGIDPEEGHQAGAPGCGRIGQRDQGPQDRRVLLGRRRADGGDHRSRVHAGHEDPAARPRGSARRDEQEARAAVREGHHRAELVRGAWTSRSRTSTSGTSSSTSDKMSDQMAYDIVKTLMEKKPELVAVHKEAQNIDLKYQKIGSPMPYHPGARKYFEEQGVKF